MSNTIATSQVVECLHKDSTVLTLYEYIQKHQGLWTHIKLYSAIEVRQ